MKPASRPPKTKKRPRLSRLLSERRDNQGEGCLMMNIRWRVVELRERVMVAIAWMAPRWLVYWCAIRLGAEATTRDDDRRFEGNYPDMTFQDALQRW